MARITTFERSQNSLLIWVPVFLGLATIAGESTRTMGSTTTSHWLLHLINLFHPQAATHAIDLLNVVLRKCGHFLGYGLLGIICARAWFSVLRRKLTVRWFDTRMYAALCGIGSVLIIASADEIHQIYLPGRGASVHDVLLDTSGAILMNLIFLSILVTRRRRLIGVRIYERMRAHTAARYARIAIRRVRTHRMPMPRANDAA